MAGKSKVDFDILVVKRVAKRLKIYDIRKLSIIKGALNMIAAKACFLVSLAENKIWQKQWKTKQK